MTPSENLNPEHDAPTLIVTMHLSTFDEALEAMGAVDVLGLGCKVRNEWRADPDLGKTGHTQVWILELFDDAPYVTES